MQATGTISRPNSMSWEHAQGRLCSMGVQRLYAAGARAPALMQTPPCTSPHPPLCPAPLVCLIDQQASAAWVGLHSWAATVCPPTLTCVVVILFAGEGHLSFPVLAWSIRDGRRDTSPCTVMKQVSRQVGWSVGAQWVGGIRKLRYRGPCRQFTQC
jgi:hypothetical protein